MPGIRNNLYPPIISTYMPAFVRTSACRIYFSLSIYNSIEDIKNVQIIISNQNNNLSVLKKEQYPTEIKITNLSIDNNIKGDNKYYITISPEDLESGIFELNQFYKVQIRFTGIGASDIIDSKKIASWLTNNQKFFSEWSTVCLIKGIQKPLLNIKGFENSSNSETIFTHDVIDLVGTMYYEENSEIEKEFLKSYEIKLYNATSNILLFKSGIIYTNQYNPNEINYTIKYKLEDGIKYKVEIIYTTNNEYNDSNEYLFSIVQNGTDPLRAKIIATPDIENGRIRIDIVATITEVFVGNLAIRRSSDKSNFLIWEDVKMVTIESEHALNYSWYDYTVESGIWYKYCAQKVNSKGDRGAIINIRYPVMIVLDDIFLTRENMQLKVKYNPSITSFKKTLSESKIDTIGSKYPHIRRNGNIGYRQFPISGLITAFCDEDGIFLNKDNIYGDSKYYYEQYNIQKNIDQYQDYIYERKFREKVMDFLYENNVKLFRSTTEGNILIKLMDISFSPNQTLGRMIYSFSANAYEIDDCSQENLEKYGIQSIGKYSDYLTHIYNKVGQIQGTYKGTKQNLLSLLQNKYGGSSIKESTVIVNYVKWLKIEFNSAPYLIKTNSNGSIEPLPKDEKSTEDTVCGYIVYINEVPMVISSRRYFELNDSDIKITSVWFPTNTDVIIDYSVELSQTENPVLLYSKIYYYTKVGQIHEIFNINDSVVKMIYLKYLINYYKSYYQELVTINKINIEAIPGTVVYIKDSFDEEYTKYIIGNTGILELYDEDTTIDGLYFSGIQLYHSKDTDRDEVIEGEFIETNIIVNNFSEITNPIRNGVYIIKNQEINDFPILNSIKSIEKTDDKYISLLKKTIEDSDKSNRYIYYNSCWYLFTNENIVLCPVEALIDYIYDLTKGEY